MPTTVIATSATELTDKQKSVLVAGLEKKFGKVTLTERIDVTLIGGLKITVGSRQFDASLSTRFSELRQKMK